MNVKSRGIAKALRVSVFTDSEIQYYDKDLLIKMFLDELSERSWKKSNGRTVIHGDEYLWYISYEGRLGMVKKGGSKCWAEKLTKQKKIVPDNYGIMRGQEVLNNCGCQHPAHRPIIEALSRGRWSQYVVDTLSNILDGGKALEMVIDRDFAAAYAPDYDVNTHIDDLVCSYSCMSGRPDDAQDFYGNIDGCYVARFLKNGEDVGRCIMYEYNGRRHFIRIYCQEEYQRDCLYTLRKNMRPDDLFGRDEFIPGLCLQAHFDENTPNMYLDGEEYGLNVDGGRLYVQEGNYDDSGSSTSRGALCDALDNIHICHSCGDWLSDYDDPIKVDGYYYCNDSCAEDDGLCKCAHCGEWMTDPDIRAEDGQVFCCRSCAFNEDYVCTVDGDWYYYDDVFSPNDGDDYYVDEEDAINHGWHKCVDCDKWCMPKCVCADGEYRCEDCLEDGGWKLTYTKEQKDEETETSND